MGKNQISNVRKEDFLSTLKKVRRKKGQKDPFEEKRAPSGYILYTKDERVAVMRDFPDLGAKEVIKELGRRWNNLDPSVRHKYIEKSKELSKKGLKTDGKVGVFTNIGEIEIDSKKKDDYSDNDSYSSD